MTASLLIFGQNGQLARALKARLKNHGCRAVFIGRADCDLSHGSQTIKDFMVGLEKPGAVIIAAAYTAVDAAESDAQTAFAVNAEAPTAIAQICADWQIPLVHISTDYVFDGQAKMPYMPSHPPNPINVYGASKLAGEGGILASNARAAILRTAWVFDGTGKNFLTAMLKVAQTKTRLDIVGDQIGRPTYAGHLADAALTAATALCENPTSKSKCGIFHVTGEGPPISWADFAAHIFRHAQHDIPHPVTITPVTTSDYQAQNNIKTKRPLYSVLDTHTFEQAFDTALPNWTEGIEAAVKEYKSNQ